MNKAELIVQGVLLELHYVVSEETFNRLVELVNNQLNAEQSVHLTAFGASARAHIAHWLISLAYHILPNGGR